MIVQCSFFHLKVLSIFICIRGQKTLNLSRTDTLYIFTEKCLTVRNRECAKRKKAQKLRAHMTIREGEANRVDTHALR